MANDLTKLQNLQALLLSNADPDFLLNSYGSYLESKVEAMQYYLADIAGVLADDSYMPDSSKYGQFIMLKTMDGGYDICDTSTLLLIIRMGNQDDVVGFDGKTINIEQAIDDLTTSVAGNIAVAECCKQSWSALIAESKTSTFSDMYARVSLALGDMSESVSNVAKRAIEILSNASASAADRILSLIDMMAGNAETVSNLNPPASTFETISGVSGTMAWALDMISGVEHWYDFIKKAYEVTHGWLVNLVKPTWDKIYGTIKTGLDVGTGYHDAIYVEQGHRDRTLSQAPARFTLDTGVKYSANAMCYRRFSGLKSYMSGAFSTSSTIRDAMTRYVKGALSDTNVDNNQADAWWRSQYGVDYYEDLLETVQGAYRLFNSIYSRLGYPESLKSNFLELYHIDNNSAAIDIIKLSIYLECCLSAGFEVMLPKLRNDSYVHIPMPTSEVYIWKEVDSVTSRWNVKVLMYSIPITYEGRLRLFAALTDSNLDPEVDFSSVINVLNDIRNNDTTAAIFMDNGEMFEAECFANSIFISFLYPRIVAYLREFPMSGLDLTAYCQWVCSNLNSYYEFSSNSSFKGAVGVVTHNSVIEDIKFTHNDGVDDRSYVASDFAHMCALSTAFNVHTDLSFLGQIGSWVFNNDLYAAYERTSMLPDGCYRLYGPNELAKIIKTTYGIAFAATAVVAASIACVAIRRAAFAARSKADVLSFEVLNNDGTFNMTKLNQAFRATKRANLVEMIYTGLFGGVKKAVLSTAKTVFSLVSSTFKGVKTLVTGDSYNQNNTTLKSSQQNIENYLHQLIVGSD